MYVSFCFIEDDGLVGMFICMLIFAEYNGYTKLIKGANINIDCDFTEPPLTH